MRTLVLEDEIPAMKKMISLLTSHFGKDIDIEHARTVKGGVELLGKGRDYDLILSDIRLLDGTAFDIFQEVVTKAPIIFCTAHEEHLLEAFHANGIAYVLKPYGRNELVTALKKYETWFEPKTLEKEIYGGLKELLDTKGAHYKKRFAIKKKGGIELLEVSDMSMVQACGDFCKVIDSKGRLLSISKNIGTLGSELDPEHFFRANRSQIIAMAHIERMAPYSKNRVVLKMKGTTEQVITSTSSTKAFRKWIEG